MTTRNLERQAALERMELYRSAHPGSPSAMQRPRLSKRGDVWIALLGPNVQNGIVGLGLTVEGALRAFDARYLSSVQPPMAA